MNGIYIVIFSVLVLVLCYRYYGAFMAAKVLVLDSNKPTPAVVHEDGHDYVLTNKWVIFGHHFAAIAGAGPLVGLVLAAQFGYLPGLLWLLIGGCIAGAVHDTVILFASIRHDGLSIAEIAKKEINASTVLAASVAVIFILIITMASMTLAIGTTILIRMGRTKYIWTTLLPLCFMIVSALAAGVYNIFFQYLPTSNYLLASASLIMIVLIVFVIYNAAMKWIEFLKENKKSLVSE